MTAGELASVMGAFLTGRLPIVGAQQAQAMLANGFGVDLIASTKLGSLYAKARRLRRLHRSGGAGRRLLPAPGF